jgi:hypothetical protein
VIQGRVSAAVTVTLRLSRVGRKAGGLTRRVRLTPRSGRFTQRVPVNARLLPGRYTVRLATGGIQAASRSLTLPAPLQGILATAGISLQRGGPTVLDHPGGTGRLYARFRFQVPPRASSVRVGWIDPHGDLVQGGLVRKRSGRVVDTEVFAKGLLRHGRWQALLKVGGLEVGRARVRLG